MRVPQYKSQTQRTNKTGGGTLSVQANPGALSAGLDAFAGFARNVQQQGLNFYEQELKTQRASALAGAETELDTKLDKRQLEALDQDPDAVKGNWEKATKSDVTQIANNISDPVVARRFKAKAIDSIGNKTLNVLKDARNRRIDKVSGQYALREDRLIQKIATGNKAEANQAELELFGVPQPNGTLAGGLYDEMLGLGLFKLENLVNKRQGAFERIDNLKAEKELTAATLSGDPSQVLTVLGKLSDPSYLSQLKPETRNSLVTRANSLVNTLQSQKNSEADREIRLGEKNKKLRQGNNFNDFMGQVRDAQSGLNGATMPSMVDITKSFGNDGISDKQFEALQTVVLSGDAPVNNTQVVSDIYMQIDKAENAEEIDAIVATVPSKLGPTGTIKLETAIAIRKYAESSKGDTPEAQDIKFYRSLLSKAIGQEGYAEKYVASAALRQADAMDAFATLTDPTSPTRVEPKIAFNRIKVMYARGLDEDLTFVSPTTKVREFIVTQEGNGSTKIKSIKNWTVDDVNKAVDFISNSRSLRPVEKALELETLGQIQDLIKKRDEALDAPLSSEPEISGAGGATSDGILDSIKNMIKNAQNPTR